MAEEMTGTKKQLSSTTIKGVIISGLGLLVPILLGFIGIDMNPETVSGLVEQLGTIIDEGMQLFGLAMAWYGRVVATTKIGK